MRQSLKWSSGGVRFSKSQLQDAIEEGLICCWTLAQRGTIWIPTWSWNDGSAFYFWRNPEMGLRVWWVVPYQGCLIFVFPKWELCLYSAVILLSGCWPPPGLCRVSNCVCGIHGQDFGVQSWWGEVIVQAPEDLATAVSRWCGPDGTINPTALARSVHCWVWGGRDLDWYL